MYVKPVCWLPSSGPVTAETRWSRNAEFSIDCRALGGDNLHFQAANPTYGWPDTIYFASPEWIWEYRVAEPVQPIAFEYDGRGWALSRREFELLRDDRPDLGWRRLRRILSLQQAAGSHAEATDPVGWRDQRCHGRGQSSVGFAHAAAAEIEGVASVGS